MRRLAPLVALALAACAPKAPPPDPMVPVEEPLSIADDRYTLDNGLEVVLAPDPSAPLVFVQVWYDVGSKDEEPGLTGFAHLFEHLMFQGSLNAPGDYFLPLQEIGARVNGTTSFDRTEYHQQLPAEYLPLALFLESDRLGWFLPTLDQTMLDNQRDVVRNERRQRYENPPYGEVWVDLFATLFPEGHPYNHMPIGSHEDLEAADLDVVREFFQTWYMPNNATLVIVGDFDPDGTRALVEEYFGPIPRGEEPTHATAEPVVLPEPIELRQYDAVPEQKVWLAWPSPPFFDEGDAELDLLSSVLSDGRDSRLYNHLVRDLRVAKEVSAQQVSFELASIYLISATASDGHTTDEVVAAIDEVVAEVLGDAPPTGEELEAARAGYEVDAYQRLTTLRGRGSLMSLYNHYTGEPDYLQQDIERYRRATVEEVVAAGRAFLEAPRVSLHVWPERDRPDEEASDEPDDRADTDLEGTD